MSDDAPTAGEPQNTPTAGEPPTTPEGSGEAPERRTFHPEKQKEVFNEGFDKGWGKGKDSGRKEGQKQILGELGFESVDELKELVESVRNPVELEPSPEDKAQAEATAKELAETSKQHRKLQTEHRQALKRLELAEARADQARLDRIRASAAKAEGQRVLPGNAMDLFVAAVKDRVHWNEAGDDVVVMMRTDSGEYINRGDTLEDLITEAREQMPFLFESSGRTGAGSSTEPVDSQALDPFEQALKEEGESVMDTVRRLQQRRGH